MTQSFMEQKSCFQMFQGKQMQKICLQEYNAGFMLDMRRFLKSDEGMISAQSSICEEIPGILVQLIIWRRRMVYAV